MAPEDAQEVEPWASWAEAYAELLLRCAARWTCQRMISQAGSEVIDALPCIRLLLDSYFTKQLEEVYIAVCMFRYSDITQHHIWTQNSLVMGMWGQPTAKCQRCV